MANVKANVTRVSSANTNTPLLVPNSKRVAVSLFNDSSQAVFVKCGVTSSATDFTVKMAAGAYYELPIGNGREIFIGQVDAIWVSANGAMQVTEFYVDNQ